MWKADFSDDPQGLPPPGIQTHVVPSLGREHGSVTLSNKYSNSDEISLYDWVTKDDDVHLAITLYSLLVLHTLSNTGQGWWETAHVAKD
jgi:hypothetical protein